MRSTLAVLLLLFASTCAVAAELPSSYAGQDAERWFGVVSGLSGGGLAALDGQQFTFAVDLQNDGPGVSVEIDRKAGKAVLLYRMAFNNIAEGWSWEPGADPEQADYYRFKFLPLKSVVEEKSPPATVELYPGNRREVRNLWRYDYFLAFDNLYDFYPRQVNDDAGFRAEIPLDGAPEPAGIGMLALCRLKPPYFAESNTFWKADYAEPVDRTLRKRYLMVELLEVRFYDYASGKVLAKVTPTAR